MRRIWKWTDFSWWLADNPYLWQAGQYQNGSFNIDTQTEPGIVKLTPKLESYLTTTWNPSIMLNLAEFWDSGILVFADDWKIYKDWTLIYTLSTTPKTVFWATAQYDAGGTLYVYWMTAGAIHRATTNFTTSVTENFKTTADWIVSWNEKKYMINIYDNIYFGSRYKFHKLTQSWILSTIYSFSVNELIVWITFFQDNFYVYTKSPRSWNAVNGRQYVFGMTNLASNSSPTYNTLWRWLPILWATNLWSKDYVVTWMSEQFSDLYITSGTQRQLLKTNNEWSDARWFNGVLTSRLDDVYIAGSYNYSSWFVEGNNDSYWVYRFWAYYPGQKEILQKIIKTWESVQSLLATDTDLYIGTDANKVYRYSFQQSPNYATTWELVSLQTDLWSPTTKKSLTEVYVGYDMSNNNISSKGGTITVYMSADNWNYRQIWTVTVTSWIGNFKIMPNAILTQAFGKFTKCSFKVKLAPNGTTETPWFTGLEVIFDDNVWLN